MKTQIVLLSFMPLFLGLSGSSFRHQANVQPTLLVQTHFPANAVRNDQGNVIVNRPNFLAKDVIEREAVLNKKMIHSNKSDTTKNNLSYKIIYSSPNLKYTIRKNGQGKRVMFSINNGMGNFPEFTFTQTSGTEYTTGFKRGFDNIVFPFTCRINCSTSYHNFQTLLNNFEVEIIEPGDWEISFNYLGV